ncbi:dihydroorotate dehydrogenase [Candidatus Calescamantes bacterium]|nr:dihydroorotate dehydrogenase [Candidatus Calescamantes bacterium]
MNLKVKFLEKELRTPIILASGVSGYADELIPFLDSSSIGALTTKTITLQPREGNPPPRIMEVPGGIINSIGLANMGIEAFIKEKLSSLLNLPMRKIVSIGGEKEEEFSILAKKLSRFERIDFLELNLSCPNIERKRLFAQEPETCLKIIKKTKKVSPFPVIAKLSPQVTDIKEIALACEEGGVDALNLINTVPVLCFYSSNKKIHGGLSGPSLKPLSLRLIEEVRKVTALPIIGTGGIYSGKDIIDYFLAGANCISLGSVLLLEPGAVYRIKKELETFILSRGYTSLLQFLHSTGL